MKAAKRKKLRGSQFAWPAKRKYPIDTRGRAINAKTRAKQMLKRGRLSKAQYEKIRAKANKRLKRKK